MTRYPFPSPSVGSRWRARRDRRRPPRPSTTSTGTWCPGATSRPAPHVGRLLPPPRCPPGPRRHRRGLRDPVPLPRLALRRRGHNVDIPYSARTNKRARIRTYPTLEVNGKSPRLVPPRPDGPPVGHPGARGVSGPSSSAIRTRQVTSTPPRSWARTRSTRPTSATCTTPPRSPRSPTTPPTGRWPTCAPIQQFPTPRGVVDGKIESLGYGPGVSIVRFAGIVDTLLVARPPRSTPAAARRASTSTPGPWATPRPTPTWPRPSCQRSTGSSSRTCRCGSTRPT